MTDLRDLASRCLDDPAFDLRAALEAEITLRVREILVSHGLDDASHEQFLLYGDPDAPPPPGVIRA